MIHFTPKAEADFAALTGYVADRDPHAASGLARRIFDIVDKLAHGDFDGPQQTLLTGEPVCSWPVPPARIYYQRRARAFWVLRIYHQARRPIVR